MLQLPVSNCVSKPFNYPMAFVSKSNYGIHLGRMPFVVWFLVITGVRTDVCWCTMLTISIPLFNWIGIGSPKWEDMPTPMWRWFWWGISVIVQARPWQCHWRWLGTLPITTPCHFTSHLPNPISIFPKCMTILLVWLQSKWLRIEKRHRTKSKRRIVWRWLWIKITNHHKAFVNGSAVYSHGRGRTTKVYNMRSPRAEACPINLFLRFSPYNSLSLPFFNLLHLQHHLNLCFHHNHINSYGYHYNTSQPICFTIRIPSLIHYKPTFAILWYPIDLALVEMPIIRPTRQPCRPNL